MTPTEAQAFITETRQLLHRAANAESLTPAEERRLIELEADALQHLREQRDVLRITAFDGAAVPPAVLATDENPAPPTATAGIRFEPVVMIEEQPAVKIVQRGDEYVELRFNRYIAHGDNYKAKDGRTAHDTCASSAEGFIDVPDDDLGTRPFPFGAASALAARLLEPLAAGKL